MKSGRLPAPRDYDPSIAGDAVTELIQHQLDLVNIARCTETSKVHRPGHKFGNVMFTEVVGFLFGREFTDMSSGYKIFSRRFVKSFPAVSKGFEIETELIIHALELTMPVSEREAAYGSRPVGSVSKLNTVHDGVRILRTVVRLLKNERPLASFGLIGLGLIAVAIALGVPLVETYVETGLVPRLPTAMLAVGMVLMGVQTIAAGIILDTVTTRGREAKRMAYLRIQPVECAAHAKAAIVWIDDAAAVNRDQKPTVSRLSPRTCTQNPNFPSERIADRLLRHMPSVTMAIGR